MTDQPTFVVVTPMKNEGPFIVEWVAHHKAIGADTIVVFSNNCTDGSDALLDRLHEMGAIVHVDNSSDRPTSPQKRAYRTFMKMDEACSHDWIVVIDADEQINIKTGDNTLQALAAAVPDARMISMTWRLFGNAGVIDYEDRFLSEQFRRCAPEHCPKPVQAWGFKTMFRAGDWGFIRVHRPKRPNVPDMAAAQWVNGSGQPMPERYFARSWRSMRDSVGYDLVQLNHYALKSCESYLVKKMRGRAHHVGGDLGYEYWTQMNQNGVEDHSIDMVHIRKKAAFDELMSDRKLADLHKACCDRHAEQIAVLREQADMKALLDRLLAVD